MRSCALHLTAEQGRAEQLRTFTPILTVNGCWTLSPCFLGPLPLTCSCKEEELGTTHTQGGNENSEEKQERKVMRYYKGKHTCFLLFSIIVSCYNSHQTSMRPCSRGILQKSTIWLRRQPKSANLSLKERTHYLKCLS